MADLESEVQSTGPARDGPPGDADGGLIATKKDFIRTFFARAEDFIETLLKENGRLRYRVLELEARLREAGAPAESGGAVNELVGRVGALEAERDQMLARFSTVQRDNVDFEERSREIERENNSLANMYVATYQLHGTVDLGEITRIIVEILLNFIGARTFALLLLDETRGELVPLAAEGIARHQVPRVRAGEGPIGAVVSTGKALLEGAGGAAGQVQLDRPLVVSPLRIKEKVVGVIVIWEFLRQKTEMADVDYELLDLLAAHAASALTSAKLLADLGDRPAALWGAVDLV